MRIETIEHEQKSQFSPWVAAGLAEWSKGEDAKFNGEAVGEADQIILVLLLSDPDYILRILFKEDERIGFAIERRNSEDWLLGIVLWLEPKERRLTWLPAYFKRLREIAGAEGFYGIRFDSTLPFWQLVAPASGFRFDGEQSQLFGPPVLRWRMEV